MNQIKISDYLIAIVELLEAEAAAAKSSFLKLFVSLVLISIAALLLVGGLVFLFYGVYQLLLVWLSPLLTAFILAALLLCCAIALIFWALRR